MASFIGSVVWRAGGSISIEHLFLVEQLCELKYSFNVKCTEGRRDLLGEPPEDGGQLLVVIFARLELLPGGHNLGGGVTM